MLKLELDWAGETMPELGLQTFEGQPTGVTIEAGPNPGPSGWPVIVVFATDGPTLWSWLLDEYCSGPSVRDAEGLASDLASLAVSI